MDTTLYDTTLRDGTQRRGLSLTLADKLKIAHELDRFGIPYIECGWPGSNPKDCAFFEAAKGETWLQAKLVAFGSTRRVGTAAEDDVNLRALLEAETPAVALVAKSWILHVEKVLNTTPEENLNLIRDSVAFMKAAGREVIYDGEHFFDGFRADEAYAMATLTAAVEAGADWLVLCDTNGGSLPSFVSRVTARVKAAFPHMRLGIHAHNDSELAVANSLVAVEAGAGMIQGTVNGYGERCGNANLVSLIPNLQLKLGRRCIAKQQLARLTELAHMVAETANLNPDPHQAYVGHAAFAHKGGIHVAAVEKLAASYEHISPETVGNTRQIAVSELSGRGNVRVRAAELGFELRVDPRSVLDKVKELENRGFHFESAEGSFELIARRMDPEYKPPFAVLDTFVVSERRGKNHNAEATVKLLVGKRLRHTAAEGGGPVQALDHALRKAVLPCFPELANVRLVDYKVRILDTEAATAATTRVLIEAAAGEERWCTVGCSDNIIDASTQALVDSLELYLLRHDIQPASGREHQGETYVTSTV
ncbi:MAG: citramalate synthase [Acidobacteriota bacterium]|nr:citramalate synthase [Acidobacteriota bacterium]